MKTESSGHTGWRVRAVAVVAAIAVAGCGGGDDDDDTQARAETADVADDDAGDPADDRGDEAFIDACTLLSEAEAAEVLGMPVVDREEATGERGWSRCRWKEDRGWSVTVEIGSAGTAPGDEFDPASVYGGSSEPVPSLDGAWYVGMGTVAFASHGRVITVFVATGDGGGSGDREAAEELAALGHRRIQDAAG